MRWKLAAATSWTLLIIALCSIPGDSLPAAPVASADKLIHFAVFFVFGWLWLEVTGTRTKKAVRNVLIAGLLLAVLTELYQGLLPFHRHPDGFDAIANMIGVLAGVGGCLKWRRFRAPAATASSR